MKGLIIRDFINYKSVYVAIAILIPIGYVLTLPPFQISLGMLLPVLLIGVFYSDHQSRINQYLVSLPISRSSIVISRYISMLIVWIGTIIYQLIIGNLMAWFVPYNVFTFGWKEIVTLLCLGLIMLAFFIPIFFLFRSFLLPIIIIVVCYFTVFFYSLDALVNLSGMETEIIFNFLDQWVVPLIESVLTFYPFLILTILGFCLFFISMKVSEKLLSGKNMI
ncbi:ABC-2 transporter permease [Paucisalibacillus sp. EB02]|uniref:ABC-2 transporter permease n=1 Tax=Paucisalibacillus sp. EB02 TaxID=1347087 RepID=UPI0004B07595|nr:ABC-2 transporter permease [Paucisalibacillus sp. EB02]